MSEYVVFGRHGTGSVPVEAALHLIGAPFRVVEATGAPDDPALAANPLRQLPALLLPDGILLTESLAILLTLAERHPEARLAPAPDDPRRAAFLRWMAFVSGQIYALFWIRDDLSRLSGTPDHRDLVMRGTVDRIAFCWSVMEANLKPGRFLLGDDVSVLDLYVAMISRWAGGRARFAEAAPTLAQIVLRVDADPRLAHLWARRTRPIA